MLSKNENSDLVIYCDDTAMVNFNEKETLPKPTFEQERRLNERLEKTFEKFFKKETIYDDEKISKMAL